MLVQKYVLSLIKDRQCSFGKVTFSPSICQPVQRSHVTITHDALDLTVQGPQPCPTPLQTRDIGTLLC